MAVFELTYLVKFYFLKNPLSLFIQVNSRDPTKYLDNLLSTFKKNYGYVTKRLPLREGDFKLAINDQLFTQFYLQIQNVIDHSKARKNSNFQQFIINH